MTPVGTTTTNPAVDQRKAPSALEQSGQELILYRLRCAQTANGLSHYYMYGDIAPEQTLL